jgi:hypothetical protein
MDLDDIRNGLENGEFSSQDLVDVRNWELLPSLYATLIASLLLILLIGLSRENNGS